MKCYSLLIGARNTPSGGKRFSTREESALREVTFRHFPDGFTILNADGGWYDPKEKRFVQEESRQILVTARSARALRAWCDELGELLQQQEFMVVELGAARTFRPEVPHPRKGASPHGARRNRR